MLQTIVLLCLHFRGLLKLLDTCVSVCLTKYYLIHYSLSLLCRLECLPLSVGILPLSALWLSENQVLRNFVENNKSYVLRHAVTEACLVRVGISVSVL